jgi:hypothetical protein
VTAVLTFAAMIVGITLAFALIGWMVMSLGDWAASKERPDPTMTLDQMLDGKGDQ